MEYLYQQFPTVGYPSAIYYSVVVIGVVLILFRPFWAILFAVFCLAGKNFHAAILTRNELTGMFLNLNDLLLWIALAGMLVENFRLHRKIYLPKILVAIIIILTIGALQSVVKYGFELFVFRSIWSVAIFPILFVVGANMICKETQVRFFYWSLFMGAVTASVQHMIFLSYMYRVGIFAGPQIRTISYLASGGLLLIVVAVFSKLREKGNWVIWSYYTGLMLMAISSVMNQTRQLYVVIILVIATIPFLLKKSVNINKTFIKLGLLTISVVVFINMVFADLNFTEIIGERLEFLKYEDTFYESYLTRSMGMQTEINLWLDSPIIVGTGVAYPPEFTEPYRGGFREATLYTGALDHVAISSYLAHYGLSGAFIYLLFLPVLTIKAAKKFLSDNSSDYGAKVALLAIIVALMDMFNLFGSMLNTSPGSHITALIYGALWGLYINKTQNNSVIS